MTNVLLHTAVKVTPGSLMALSLACSFFSTTLRGADVAHTQGILTRARALPVLSEAMQAVALNPDAATAHAKLAGALFRNGDFVGAEERARKALLLDPGTPDAMVVLARCLKTSGEVEEAGERLRKAVEVDPRHAEALRLLAGMVDLNDRRDVALELTRRFVGCNPEDQRLFVEHARKMLKLLAALGSLELSKQPPREKRPERIELPMRLTGKGLSIELQVGDVKRPFCLDTGEESITVRAETAKALGFKKLADLPAVTASGVGRMPVVLAPRIEAGGFRVENVLLSLGAVDVVGPAFFSDYVVRMDFDDRRLVLIRQAEDVLPGPKDLIGAPKGSVRHRFRRLGNLIWVPISSSQAPTTLRKRPAWGILDTGCQYPTAVTIRYLDALRSDPGKGPLALPFRAEVSGAAGSNGRPVVFYALKGFDIGFLGAKLSADGSAATASFGDISKTAEAEMDLLIGWPLIHRAFKSIEIDFKRCLLSVEPRGVALPPAGIFPRLR